MHARKLFLTLVAASFSVASLAVAEPHRRQPKAPAPTSMEIPDDPPGGGDPCPTETIVKTFDYSIASWAQNGTHTLTITRNCTGVLSVTLTDGAGNVERTLSTTDLARARAGSLGTTFPNPGYTIISDPTLTTRAKLARPGGRAPAPAHMQFTGPGAAQSTIVRDPATGVFTTTVRGIQGSELVVTSTVR
jgi:hypothetical protein